MRNLKRFLAMTLTMLMVVSCFSFASFAQSFDDVSEYQTAIDVLSDLGVVWGYEDGTFGPDDAVERWHMSLWIAKMETGKTTSDDYLTIWRAEENYTDFTDVAVDQAIGAINYAADEAIIIGTSATTFAPTAGIMYQDALTMVVRALGFGGKAMDAGYPWKYINKAAELGLEDGIKGVAYKDVLTRAQTAQILYNALYTVDADGNSYISDVFGLTTVVITGTPAYKIIETESVIKTGYVSFNVLNADGTINGDVTYHAPATAFGIEAAAADTYVGASFKVTTDNNFKTFGIVIANPSETFEASEIVGAGTAAAPTGVTVKLGDDTYEAVNKYSSLYNVQGIKGNTAEILVFTTNLTQATTDGYFKVDVNYNVLDKDGKIVAYYAPAITGSYAAPYAKRLGNDAYTVFLNNSEIIAAGGVWYGIKSSEYAQTVNTYDLVKNNKYATAIAYDDNADGAYDRLFYTYHEFCNISLDTDTTAVTNDYKINGRTVVVNKFIDGKTGEALATAPTGYIRYSYNPLSMYLTVYETYTFGTGLVTTVNTASAKIVIGGTAYTVGIGTFPGATYGDTGVNIGLVGKQVNFILADGVVVRVFDAAVASSAIIFDNITGLTAQGYATALVYVQSPAASVITIATINGYSYQQYSLIANQSSLNNIIKVLKTGDLFTGTKDALGFWHLTTLAYTNAASQGSIAFKNGIGTAAGFTNALALFETSADTVYIVYNKATDRFITAKGIPVNGSAIGVIGNLYSKVTDGVANFIYANEGSFSNFAIQAAAPVFMNDTVIYVNKSAQPTLVTNDLGNNGTLLGNTYLYGNVLDMLSGKLITVYVPYNFVLDGGCYYNVYNGYVEGKVTIGSGWLDKFGTYSSEVDTNNDQISDKIVDSTKTYIYKLINGDVELVDSALVNRAVTAPLAKLNSKVYFYSGNMTHNNVMLIDETIVDPYVHPVTTILGTVSITGDTCVGETLTATISDPNFTAADVTYQWMKGTFINGGLLYQPIPGATGSSWKLLADDLATYFKVVVTGKAANYFTGSLTSEPVGPIGPALTN